MVLSVQLKDLFKILDPFPNCRGSYVDPLSKANLAQFQNTRSFKQTETLKKTSVKKFPHSNQFSVLLETIQLKTSSLIIAICFAELKDLFPYY